MNVRPANPADLDRCEHLDGGYRTGYIWQMQTTALADRMETTFQRIRTPRPLDVPCPNPPSDLYGDWRRNECLLVACERTTVFGYLDMTVQRAEWHGWLEHLVVEQGVRRQGIGTLLLVAAERWACGSELAAISVALQSRNDPGVQLCQRRGFGFRGYLDRYFANGDPALIYTLYL